MATNGQERTAAEITADVVKKNGLDLAQDIRALAERARKEGEALAVYAEETANHIIQASEQAAARIAGYLARTADARQSVKDHSDKLADLPEKNEPHPTIGIGAEAVENALSSLGAQYIKRG